MLNVFEAPLENSLLNFVSCLLFCRVHEKKNSCFFISIVRNKRCYGKK